MQERKRIVITGIGVISPIGQDVATFRDNLFAGRGGIDRVSFPYRGQEVSFPAAPVKDFDPGRFFDPKKANYQDRFAQLGLAAAVQAWQDSGLELTDEVALSTGAIIGSGVGGQSTLEESYGRILPPDAPGRVHPFTIPRLMVNAAASHISMGIGLKGPSFTVASACASAVHGMGVALTMLRAGLMDRCVTGGAESCLTFGTLKGWEALRVMAPDVCRPFSEGRAGLVVGEGAAMFVLETLESAKARGATIYAEFLGFGMSSDAQDLTAPDATGAARAIVKALEDTGLTPSDIDHINAHGTGTKINDATETKALKIALGERATQIPVTASKSLFGHALGAAGALEMLTTVLSVREGIVPPTINYLGPDPECDLDVVHTKPREASMRVALNNAFAFGGLNAVAVVGKHV